MSKNTTNVNHSDLPCTCGTLEQYVDGLCPGCIETADRTADLNNECIYPQPSGNPFPQEMIDDAFEGDDVSEPREEREDRYYSGTGEMIGDGPDDDSYTRYLDRG